MPSLGPTELLLIFVIALIVFGPRKLPDIGKSLGRMLSEFRRASSDLRRTIEDEVEAERLRDPAAPHSDQPASPAPAAPLPYGPTQDEAAPATPAPAPPAHDEP